MAGGDFARVRRARDAAAGRALPRRGAGAARRDGAEAARGHPPGVCGQRLARVEDAPQLDQGFHRDAHQWRCAGRGAFGAVPDTDRRAGGPAALADHGYAGPGADRVGAGRVGHLGGKPRPGGRDVPRPPRSPGDRGGHHAAQRGDRMRLHGPGRRGGAAADPQQPGGQRDQVHPLRRRGPSGVFTGGKRRGHRGLRHGHRYPARAPRTPF